MSDASRPTDLLLVKNHFSAMKVVKKRILQLPLEILIMIIEVLEFRDALWICKALNLPKELAYQYHNYDGKKPHYGFDIFDHKNRTVKRPNHAKAILRNARFQARATANKKVRFAILSQDLELVKYALQDPKVDHDDISLFACIFGEAETVEYILFSADVKSELYSNAFQTGRFVVVRILLSDPRFDPSDQNNLAMIDNFIKTELFNIASLDALENIRLLVSDQRVYPSANVTQAILMEIPLVEIEIIKRLLVDHRLNISVLNLCYIFIYRFFKCVFCFLFNLHRRIFLKGSIILLPSSGQQVLKLLYSSIHRFFECVFYFLVYSLVYGSLLIGAITILLLRSLMCFVAERVNK